MNLFQLMMGGAGAGAASTAAPVPQMSMDDAALAIGGMNQTPNSSAAMPRANPLASGLGHLFGTDGGHISNIADHIGKGANQIAAAGGAQPGYSAPAQKQKMPDNHLQMLDPNVLHELIQRFRPIGQGVRY